MKSKELPHESFCIIPWIQLYSVPDGACKICCYSVGAEEFLNAKGEILYMYKDDIEDIWNCDSARDIRMKMLKGGKLRECDVCYEMEEKEGTSHRLDYFSYFHDEYLNLKKSGEFENTMSNNGKAVFNPRYLNIALSNACNLSCRMCLPQFSSTRAKEAAKFISGYHGNNDGYIPYLFSIADKANDGRWQHLFEEFQKNYDFLDEGRYWAQINKCIPFLKLLMIHGGEPLMSREKVTALVNEIVAQGRQDRIHLDIITNLTMNGHKFFEKISEIGWRCLTVSFSIDGHNKLQEYIRYPQKWEIFDRNLKTLLELPDTLELSASITVNVYNVFYLTEILNYLDSLMETKGIEICISFLSWPEFLKTDVLPEHIKKLAIVKLENYLDSKKFVSDGGGALDLKSSLNLVINELKHEGGDLSDRRREFVKYTKLLDRIRGQNIMDVVPEAEPLFIS